MDTNYIKFSDLLSASIEKLYRVGGLSLVFTFLGVVMMIAGNFFQGRLSEWIFGVGAILTLVCLGLFVYFQVQAPIKARRTLRDNKETMDAVQEIAIELTRATGQMQSFAFKHISQVNKIIDITVPLLAGIPFLKSKIEAMHLPEVRDSSKLIVDTFMKAEIIINDVEDALVKADSTRLQKYSENLKQLTQNLRDALASPKKTEENAEVKPVETDDRSPE